MTFFDYVSIVLLIAFAIATWIAPRRLGVAGLVLVHVTLLVSYFVLAGFAMEIGRYEYDGLLSIIGLTLQAFVLNCLLLPIGVVALWRRRKAHNHSLDWTGAASGFPVIPVASERGQNQ